MKAIPNGEETQNKEKPNTPKGVKAVTNEIFIAAPKRIMLGEKTNTDTLVSCDINAMAQQTETDGSKSGTPDGEETQNKDEPREDKLNDLKEVKAVTNEATIRAPKQNGAGAKNSLTTLVSGDRFTCVFIVCIYFTESLFNISHMIVQSDTRNMSFSK